MDIHTNIPLKNYTTMKLGGPARFMGEAFSIQDVADIYRNGKEKNLPIFVLGSGSNVIAHDDGYPGIVVRNRIAGFEKISEDSTSVIIKVGGGENWDETVKKTVDMNLSGIEALSAIPGTVGAAPVQNIGAYGQEIADTLVSLEAYDSQTDQLVTLTSEQCGFSYRHSIFRGEAKGRFFIISVTLQLRKSPPSPPFYAALEKYFEEQGTTSFNPQVIRDAVVAIRRDKLPDPTEKPNAGSFFKNAIIEDWQVNDLKEQYPDIPLYDLGGGKYKVPTGWLIEQAGFKGQLLNGIRVHDKNALVLINEAASSYENLATTRDEIIGTVRDTFRIQIEQEPLELV